MRAAVAARQRPQAVELRWLVYVVGQSDRHHLRRVRDGSAAERQHQVGGYFAGQPGRRHHVVTRGVRGDGGALGDQVCAKRAPQPLNQVGFAKVPLARSSTRRAPTSSTSSAAALQKSMP